MAVRGSYIPAPGGSSGLTGVSVDITERKTIEEALRQGKQELSDLMGRLISAQEEERSHIARELHDDITQRLAVLAIEAGTLELQREPDHTALPGKTSRHKGEPRRALRRYPRPLPFIPPFSTTWDW